MPCNFSGIDLWFKFDGALVSRLLSLAEFGPDLGVNVWAGSLPFGWFL